MTTENTTFDEQLSKIEEHSPEAANLVRDLLLRSAQEREEILNKQQERYESEIDSLREQVNENNARWNRIERRIQMLLE